MSDGRTTRGGDNPSRKGYGFFGARTRGVQDDAVGSTPRFKRGRDRGVDAATRRTTIISAERSRSGRDRGRIDRAAGAGWMAFFRKRRARGSPIGRFAPRGRTLLRAPRYTASSSLNTKSGSFCCHSRVSLGFLWRKSFRLRPIGRGVRRSAERSRSISREKTRETQTERARGEKK